MDPSRIDTLILNIFETQCNTVFFPVLSQFECRRIVRWLHEDGVPYEVLSDEVEEAESDFTLWRKGLAKRRIGEKVMKRINKPFNDMLDSAEYVNDDSYESIFGNGDKFCKDQNFFGGSSNAKSNDICVIHEVDDDDEFSDDADSELSVASIDDQTFKNPLFLNDYKAVNQTFQHNSVDNFIKSKSNGVLVRNIIKNFEEDSMNAAFRAVNETPEEAVVTNSKKVVKKLSSDSFKSCSSAFYEPHHLSAQGDASMNCHNGNLDFDSFEEPLQTEEAALYYEATATPQNLHGYIYLFSQALKGTHRFKLGATSDLELVKTQAMQYNLDLLFVTAHEVVDMKASLAQVSHSVDSYKVNALNWFEAEYACFIDAFRQAIKSLN